MTPKTTHLYMEPRALHFNSGFSGHATGVMLFAFFLAGESQDKRAPCDQTSFLCQAWQD